ncbi:MAG TPA: condensation domain-containing protein, partial [Minicystis sp.]|nr:condensation domain-containing protein [Minicystis sp.]
RVELGEIAAAIRTHPAVRDVAVVARDHGPGDKRIVAYVVPRGAGDAATLRTLRETVASTLPDFMVPSAFVPVRSIPLNRNGKIDRAALPAPPERDRSGDVVPPRTDTEAKLLEIWRKLLPDVAFGVEDDVFELGAHSLLMTQVTARIATELHVEIALRVVFESRTVAALARRVDAALAAGAAPEAPQLAHADAAPMLSFAQERLWFLEQLSPGTPAYNLPAAVRLTGPLDEDRLVSCLRDVERRHDVLRMTISDAGGAPVPVVHAPGFMAIAHDDVRRAASPEADARAIVARDVAKPFDLVAGPLVRCRLIRVRDDERWLVIVMHHVVCDGWSSEVLLGDMAAAYASRGSAAPAPIQYFDFARWQRAALTPERVEQQLAHWRSVLTPPPAPLDLPADRQRGESASGRGGHHTFRLGADVARALRDVAVSEGATTFMTLLAGFAAWVARVTGQRDFALGTPIANRGNRQTEELIGLFVNTLVLRVEVPRGATFRALVRRVKDVALAAYAHQDLPFERLVDELRPARRLGRTPLFDVMFAVQSATRRAPAEVAGVRLEPLELDGQTSKFDLAIGFAETDAGIAATFEYSTDLFEADTIERMGEQLARVLSSVAADAGRDIDGIDLLGDHDRRALERFDATAGAPKSTTVDALVLAAADA